MEILDLWFNQQLFGLCYVVCLHNRPDGQFQDVELELTVDDEA
ncbi:MAG: hypothetical protein AAFW84_30915 [Cyanobacteria bacterium J06635_15]